jgi:hypothetical protein
MRNKIALLFSVFILASCATQPTYNGAKQNGTWEAKSQVKDLAKNNVHQLNVDFVSVQPDALRMDVTAAMGVSLATMVLQGTHVSYALYRQKKFYEGELSDHALYPLFKINLNPRVLINICFDQPVEGEGWSCITDGQGLAESCAKAGANPIKIRWFERKGEQKRVLIADNHFELQIVFKSYSPFDQSKVQGRKSPFQLEAPKDFTKYKIP